MYLYLDRSPTNSLRFARKWNCLQRLFAISGRSLPITVITTKTSFFAANVLVIFCAFFSVTVLLIEGAAIIDTAAAMIESFDSRFFRKGRAFPKWVHNIRC